MLGIRKAQIKALSNAAIQRFEDDLTVHFRDHLPEHYRALGESGTRDAIRLGIERARSYGISSEPGVTVYIRHMFLFGEDFDRDPELPWAAEALADTSIADEGARVWHLASASLAYLRELQVSRR